MGMEEANENKYRNETKNKTNKRKQRTDNRMRE